MPNLTAAQADAVRISKRAETTRNLMLDRRSRVIGEALKALPVEFVDDVATLSGGDVIAYHDIDSSRWSRGFSDAVDLADRNSGSAVTVARSSAKTVTLTYNTPPVLQADTLVGETGHQYEESLTFRLGNSGNRQVVRFGTKDEVVEALVSAPSYKAYEATVLAYREAAEKYNATYAVAREAHEARVAKAQAEADQINAAAGVKIAEVKDSYIYPGYWGRGETPNPRVQYVGSINLTQQVIDLLQDGVAARKEAQA